MEDRAAELEELIGVASPFSALQFSVAVEGDGACVFKAAEQLGLEGIVSKRIGSPYKSGRQTCWLKAKCMTEGEFVVLGAEYQPGEAAFALLARETNEGLSYAGSAFVTLRQRERDRFWTTIEKLATPKPVVTGIKGGRNANWAQPKLRVKARHMRGEGMLRRASLTEII